MKMRSLALAFSIVVAPAIAQHVSGGVKGGVALTDAFSDQTSFGPNDSIRLFSESKDYIVGPMVEVRLPFSLSVEFDALYRPLNITGIFFCTVCPSYTSSGTRKSWEFPLVGKFRLPTPLIKPTVEAGPSFRTLGSDPINKLQNLSTHGFTVGGGVEFKFRWLRTGPEIRYTRWGADAAPIAFDIPRQLSNRNQVEFLVGLSF
jgi:hypothetical protein